MSATTSVNNYDITLEELDEKTIGFGKIQEGKFNEVPYYRIPIFRTNSLGRQVPLIIHRPEILIMTLLSLGFTVLVSKPLRIKKRKARSLTV